MPSAKPNTAPSPIAAPTPIWASRCSAHQRGDAPSQLRTWCPWHSTRGPGYPPRVAARRSLADLLDGELHARSRTNADTQRSSPRRSRRTTSRSRGRDCCSSTRSGSDDRGILSGSVTAHAALVERRRRAAVTGEITAERTAPRRRLRVLCRLAG
jgi:hypothetical protein